MQRSHFPCRSVHKARAYESYQRFATHHAQLDIEVKQYEAKLPVGMMPVQAWVDVILGKLPLKLMKVSDAGVDVCFVFSCFALATVRTTQYA